MPLSPNSLLPLCLLLCAAVLAPGCGAPQRQPDEQTAPAARPVPPLPRPAVSTAAPAFDIPALLNLTANQVRAKLGKPVSDQQNDNPVSMKDLLYRKQGYELFVSYEVMSGRVFSFYIPAIKPRKDYQYLLKVGNVNQHDPRY